MPEAISPTNQPGRRRVLAALASLAALPLAACVSTSNDSRPAFAGASQERDPLAAYRVFANAGPDAWARHLAEPRTSDGLTVLALSGGGEDGAFGAGALSGWSTSGERPVFDMVTGVSTGALIAPFALLGSDHDETLRRVFAEHDAGDIMALRQARAVFGDALYDTAPLARMIKEFTPPSTLRAIAARHQAGARLFVVTSELDTARASVWDMGLIAQTGQYDLFRAILRASAALPGLFSPVEIGYASDGTTYSETHMDGGVHMQFLALPSFAFDAPERSLPGGHLYLLINNTLNPAPLTAPRTALGISQQAITTMGRASAAAAVDATQVVARSYGMDVAVTSIDPLSGIVYDPDERFSTSYMNALFDHGFERATVDTLWRPI